MSDKDACVAGCVAASCGDGFTQADVEECDDGNMTDDDECNNACELGGTFVFVTSTLTNGRFGGLAGGDAICQGLAMDAGLSGTWLAWLSTDNPADGPAKRFVHSTAPYRLVDGTKIADDWDDLIDGTLAVPINLTEGGAPADMTQRVWTNTNTTGSHSSNSDCSVWSPGGNNGAYGNRTATDSDWTNTGQDTGCSDMHHLYCFQQ